MGNRNSKSGFPTFFGLAFWGMIIISVILHFAVLKILPNPDSMLLSLPVTLLEAVTIIVIAFLSAIAITIIDAGTSSINGIHLNSSKALIAAAFPFVTIGIVELRNGNYLNMLIMLCLGFILFYKCTKSHWNATHIKEY